MHPYYRKLRKGLPSARAAFVTGCAHQVPTRHPLALADLLAEFLSQLDPPGQEPLLPTFCHPGVDLHPLDGHP